MAQFWLLAAALIILALAFLILPLLRGQLGESLVSKDANIAIARQRLAELQADMEQGLLSSEQFSAAEADIQTQLLNDVVEETPQQKNHHYQHRLAALILLITVPLLAIALYQTLGSPHWFDRELASIDSDLEQLESMEAMVGKLENKLQASPEDTEGWLMLGRSYTYLNKLDAALQAFEKAYALAPDDADVLLSYAAALGRTEEGWLTGRPAELLETAYQKHPDHPQVLFLIGHLRYQQQNLAEAIELWQQLLARLPADSEDAQQVRDAINLAQAESETPQPVVEAQSAEAAPQVRVRVSLAEGLKAQVKPQDAVFIYARAVEGSRMPLAVVKKQVKDLPFEVSLNDSMAMTPAMRLSQFPQVALEARVSFSGNAIPQSGDLVVSLTPAEVGSEKSYALEINQILP